MDKLDFHSFYSPLREDWSGRFEATSDVCKNYEVRFLSIMHVNENFMEWNIIKVSKEWIVGKFCLIRVYYFDTPFKPNNWARWQYNLSHPNDLFIKISNQFLFDIIHVGLLEIQKFNSDRWIFCTLQEIAICIYFKIIGSELGFSTAFSGKIDLVTIHKKPPTNQQTG